MKFNPTKCCVMTISLATKYKVLHNYVLHDASWISSSTLRVTPQHNLLWDTHVSAVTSKTSEMLGFLRMNFMAAPQNIIELAYLALVHPQFEYVASVWSLWVLHDITKLEKLQRSARFVSRDYHHTASISNMIDELGWESLEGRRKKMNEHSNVI